MVRARQIILAKGGAETANVFTRICLATFGQIPWHCPPAMPIEIVLLPNGSFPSGQSILLVPLGNLPTADYLR